MNKILLDKDIQNLPREQELAKSGDFVVYFAFYDQIPNLIFEIVRLRRIAFQNVGLGQSSEKIVDIESFDRNYLHVFIWNNSTFEVVGSYRVCINSIILEKYGISGLYTSTLFDLPASFIQEISSGLELSRAFVKVEYQKKLLPLYLLWRGILFLACKYLNISIFWGASSISSSYSKISQNMIVNHLLLHHTHDSFWGKIKANNPPKIIFLDKDKKLNNIPLNMKLLEKRIREIEADHKGLPILFKKYLKLGAKVLAFNIDRDFGNCLDVLMMIDLKDVNKKIIAKYLGVRAND